MAHKSANINLEFTNNKIREENESENPDSNNILTLIENLTDSKSADLEKKINKYLQNVTGSGVVFLISLIPATEEAVIHVVGEQTLEKELRFLIGNNIIHSTIKRKSHNENSSNKINPELQKILESVISPSSVCLTVPIFHPNSHILALLVCLVDYSDNPTDESHYIQIVKETFRYCLGILLNTFAYEEENRLKRQCQSLLAVARKLYSHLGDFDDLLREIMSEAKKLTTAERCSLFLFDSDHNTLIAKVFDGVSSSNAIKEVRLSKGQGIAGQVAQTGKLLNIRDAYQHPLFYKGIDESTGFRTRTILCFPIIDENGITGVAQLCNKSNNLYFDGFDEEIAMAFSIYCGISIKHGLVYKKIQDAQIRSKLSNELMIYHMKVNQQDVIKLLTCGKKHYQEGFNTLQFIPHDIVDIETPCFVIKMYEDTNLIKKFNIKRETLSRFILFVQKGYRDMPYHNWRHAFSVTHFAYVCLKEFKLVEKGYFNDLAALAFLTSCLCHDLDHRGTNNSFQTQSRSILASLYSSEGSVMERHHLSQTMCILNTEGCNFLEALNEKDYRECLDSIRDDILATDLAHHFRIVKQQTAMAKEGYKSRNKEHRNLLTCLLMTCADLSDQTKDWSVVKKIAECIYNEFFTQGDLEKSMGKRPLEMMDRDRASIPGSQIEFLSTIVIPLFEILQNIFPASACLVDTTKSNRKYWEATKPIFEKCIQSGINSMDVLKSDLLNKNKLMSKNELNNI